MRAIRRSGVWPSAGLVVAAMNLKRSRRRARQDLHYKIALAMVRQYDTIYHEDVQPANMVQNHHLAWSIK